MSAMQQLFTDVLCNFVNFRPGQNVRTFVHDACAKHLKSKFLLSRILLRIPGQPFFFLSFQNVILLCKLPRTFNPLSTYDNVHVNILQYQSKLGCIFLQIFLVLFPEVIMMRIFKLSGPF
jgi:hypothetical protein